MNMNMQYRGLPFCDEGAQAIAAADALYQAVSSAFPSRPLFFQRMDELYLDLCTARRDGNFLQQVRENWPVHFPQVVWTDAIDQLTDQYQRACRKWVWMLCTGRRDIGERQLDAINAILLLHRRLLEGLDCSEIEPDHVLVRLEMRCTMGPEGQDAKAFADWLRQSDFDRRLEQLQGNCVRRKAGGKTEEGGQLLRLAQDTLLWMKLVSMQLGENGKSSRESVREAANAVWESVVAPGSLEEAEDCVTRLEKKSKLPFGLILYPYREIRDVSAKVTAQFHFCVIYAIACMTGGPIDSQAVLSNTIELLESSFCGAAQLQDVQASVKRVLRRYCAGTGQERIDPAAARYFQKRYDFVEDCFERLRQLDEDSVSIVESEIARKKDRAAIDIALMYQEREDEAFGRLITALADPMHGNVIGQLYRIAEGAAQMPPAEEVRHLLNNLFLLMQQKAIMPIWDEENFYPGWSVRGKTVVNGTRLKEGE